MSNENDNPLVNSDSSNENSSDDSIQTGAENQAPKATHSESLTAENFDIDKGIGGEAIGEPIDATPRRSLHWKIEFILLTIMLLVALAGMAVTQASVNGAWGYWLFAVLLFGGVGTFRDFKWARQAKKPVWASLAKQILHWAILLLVMKALFWMERYNAISREAASISAILLLATTCIHAGVHFHWTFAIVGVVLAVMSVIVGVLEQSMLLSSMIILPLVLGGAFFILLKLRKASRGRR